jgi:hypothetical protein
MTAPLAGHCGGWEQSGCGVNGLSRSRQTELFRHKYNNQFGGFMRFVSYVFLALLLVSAGGCDVLGYADEIKELRAKNEQLQQKVDELEKTNEKLREQLDEYKESVAEMYQ